MPCRRSFTASQSCPAPRCRRPPLACPRTTTPPPSPPTSPHGHATAARRLSAPACCRRSAPTLSSFTCRGSVLCVLGPRLRLPRPCTRPQYLRPMLCCMLWLKAWNAKSQGVVCLRCWHTADHARCGRRRPQSQAAEMAKNWMWSSHGIAHAWGTPSQPGTAGTAPRYHRIRLPYRLDLWSPEVILAHRKHAARCCKTSGIGRVNQTCRVCQVCVTPPCQSAARTARIPRTSTGRLLSSRRRHPPLPHALARAVRMPCMPHVRVRSRKRRFGACPS